MKQRIIEKALQNQCGQIGFCKVRRYDEIKETLIKRGNVSFVDSDIEKRLNPAYFMEDAKTVIACLFSYHTGNGGNISSYAHGKDYHIVIKNKLFNIAQVIFENGYKASLYTDSSPLPERYLAYLCGLGFFGKNGMLINDVYGSEFFIGIILTDCEIEEDKPVDKTCMQCGKCIAACPGNALSGLFDDKKCVSYITQKKGSLSEEEKRAIKKSGYIWGCDICQNVCPHNHNLPITQIDEFKNNLICNLEMDEDITNKEFRNCFGERAFSWRGKNVLLRNMQISK